MIIVIHFPILDYNNELLSVYGRPHPHTRMQTPIKIFFRIKRFRN